MYSIAFEADSFNGVHTKFLQGTPSITQPIPSS